MAVSDLSILLAADQTWPGVEGSLPLLAVILVAGVGTGSLFVVSLLAYRTRRSFRHLLVTLAVGALFVRSVVGVGTVFGVVPMPIHHLVEHSLDFFIAALILYAAIGQAPGNFGADLDAGTRDRR